MIYKSLHNGAKRGVPRFGTGRLVVRIHSPRPNFSKTYRHFQYSGRVQTGSVLDHTLTRMSHSLGRCHRVLVDLQPDASDDLLGSYQEV